MSRQTTQFWSRFLVVCVVLAGCHPIQPVYLNEDGDLSHYLDVATEIEHPDVDLPRLAEVEQAREPLTLTNSDFEEIWEMGLEDAISIALQNSKVVRQIRARGGVFQVSSALAPEALTINAGQGVPTVYDPALLSTGQGGVEQALAEFDAQLSTTLFWDRSDRPQNIFNSSVFQRDQVTAQTEISKQSATGRGVLLPQPDHLRRFAHRRRCPPAAAPDDRLVPGAGVRGAAASVASPGSADQPHSHRDCPHPRGPLPA